MAFGRFLTFFVATVVLGLLQLWVVAAIVAFKDQTFANVSAALLLGDGGLFFFATTLTITSAIALFDTQPLRIGTADCNVTLILGTLVALVAVVAFCTVRSQNAEPHPNPFASYVVAQLVCAVTALSYWFYVGLRTGWFKSTA